MSKLTKSDQIRISSFEKNIKNINQLLKWKKTWEINKFFDEQDEILKYISVEDIRENLLEVSSKLRIHAVATTEKFDSILNKLRNSDELLEWKKLNESKNFFDDVDKNISSLPDMRIRQLLMKQSKDIKARVLNNIRVSYVKELLKQVDKKTFDSIDEINSYFEPIDLEAKELIDWDDKLHYTTLSKSKRDFITMRFECDKIFKKRK